MTKEYKLNIVFVNQNSPKSIDADTKGTEVVYNGNEQTIKL